MAQARADAVDRWIAEFLAVEEPIAELHGGMRYAMGLDVEDRAIRGKRLRPVLCLMTAEALGAPMERAMAFAASIELMHNFALVHDDIEDGDTLRRGRASTHVAYGLAHGINIGDALLGKVFSAVVRDASNTISTRQALLGVLCDTLDSLFAGQALDMAARTRHDFTLADYERLVQLKTGSYLAAPMLGGAIVAGAGEDVLEPLRRFGRAMGPMFQIRDDLIDLTSAKGREHVGNDIREGKRSYLVASFLDCCDPQQAAALLAILDKPREATTKEDVDVVVGLFRDSGAFARAEAECARLLEEGFAAIEDLPPALRSTLRTAAEILSKRTT
jgi:geranylgeranyl pyrophosphate synthase